jgi:hypothetical protein
LLDFSNKNEFVDVVVQLPRAERRIKFYGSNKRVRNHHCLSPRIDPPDGRLERVPVHAGPIHEPQRVGLDVSPRGGVVVAHPVLVEAALGLEPLPGEAQVERVGAIAGEGGGDVHAPDGQVGRLPDLKASAVGREDRPADMVGADVVDRPVLDDGDRAAVEPDVLAQQLVRARERVDLTDI